MQTTTRAGDFRSVLVFGSFAAVLPLLIYPHRWGLDLGWNFWGIAAAELALYFLIWQFSVRQAQFTETLSLTIQTAFLRWGCGFLFGFLAFALAGSEIREAIGDGLYAYLPAVVLQVAAAPLIIKSLWLDRRRFRRRAFAPSGASVGEFTQPHKISSADLASTNWDDLLAYVKGYSGVDACLLVDQEGLIVAQKCDPLLETDTFAPLAELLENSCLKVLRRIGEKQLDKIEAFTPRLRFSVHKVQEFWLVVVADRRTDDLINVRIQRVTEQIHRKLSEKYPQEILSPREGENVRDLRRAQ
jgi:predicted regulator of Ras-like GTPase activity (Roadblock/LC7/MglB family)